MAQRLQALTALAEEVLDSLATTWVLTTHNGVWCALLKCRHPCRVLVYKINREIFLKILTLWCAYHIDISNFISTVIQFYKIVLFLTYLSILFANSMTEFWSICFGVFKYLFFPLLLFILCMCIVGHGAPGGQLPIEVRGVEMEFVMNNSVWILGHYNPILQPWVCSLKLNFTRLFNV